MSPTKRPVMLQYYIRRLSPQGQVTIPANVIRGLGWVRGRTRLQRIVARSKLQLIPLKSGPPGKELAHP